MKLGEFTRRARASRMQKKAKYEAAFQRAIRDLDLSDVSATQRPAPTVHYLRSETRRPVLSLFPKNDAQDDSRSRV
ncbi:hypothetical protein RLW55_07315 [Hyphomicrobium sp. B1]|uniref:hypothetical protein n=1 Tax=Hyphomicrobium sp. B1 TaxID=3075651 RepID=UPI003C2C7D26